MYIGINRKDKNLFKDNCYLNTKTGKLVGCTQNLKGQTKLRKTVLKYAKKYAELMIQGKIDKPSNGDCWYCSMREVKTGKPLGKINRDNEHIKQHLIEKYYVPSLLLNAINEFPVSLACQHVLAYYWQNDNEKVIEHISFYGHARRQIESSVKKYCLHSVGL